MLTQFSCYVTHNDAFCSLSSDEEKEPYENRESREEDDEEEEMEQKLAQLKAEEVAELKRYHGSLFWYLFLVCLL